MRHDGIRIVMVGAMLLSLVACSNAGNDEGMRSKATTDGVQSFSRAGNRAQTMMHNNRSIYAERKASQAIERSTGVARAYVLIGDTNAYVALNDEDRTTTLRPRMTDRMSMQNRMRPLQVPQNMRKSIVQHVRQYAPHVQNVYISTNRNAFEQLSLYGDRFTPNRRPSPALMQQFNQYVENVFRTSAQPQRPLWPLMR